MGWSALGMGGTGSEEGTVPGPGKSAEGSHQTSRRTRVGPAEACFCQDSRSRLDSGWRGEEVVVAGPVGGKKVVVAELVESRQVVVAGPVGGRKETASALVRGR